MRDRFKNTESRCDATVGWCLLLVVVIVLLSSCQVCRAQSGVPDAVHPAVCRISNRLSGSSDLGSGTLIDKTDDGREGLVLTCAHLFSDGVGEVLVEFASGKSHRAKLIARNSQADLAALAISYPTVQPAEVLLDVNSYGRLYACGYGPRGSYRCAVGTNVGQAASAGQMSLLIGDAVRSGDSGGGVFDEQGRLVAVIWGEAQGVTYASYGQPLRSFLSRVLGQRATRVYSCPTGTCPLQAPGARQPMSPRIDRKPPALADTRWQELQRQIDQLRLSKQDRGEYLTRADLPDWGTYARVEDVQRIENQAQTQHASLLERVQSLSGGQLGRAAGTAAVGLLGLSGPAGWAVVVGATFGGWLIGRRMKRKLRGAGGRRRHRFQA